MTAPVDIYIAAEYNFMTDFNGINRHFPNPVYPSGVYDSEKQQYKYGAESIEYPNLTLSEKLYDKYGNEIPAGFYTIVISPDKTALGFYQQGILKARAKVFKTEEDMNFIYEKDKEKEILDRLEKAREKKKLKKQREIEEELKAFKETHAAKTYAELEDSQNGYYLLKYSHAGIYAEAVMQK